MTTPLEFENVSKWYGQISALTDVSLALDAGVTGLVGRNGAGKSTLLKLACGLLRPSQGEVRLQGRSPRSAPARARLGFCPDIDRYYESLSGHDFVTWMLRLQGHGRGAPARARATLESIGLGPAMTRAIRTYSKGMRQRIKLAQAIAHDPEVVLLDEPLTGLDPLARHEVGSLIKDLGGRGATVLVSSHVLHELQAVASRFVVVERGQLRAEGELAELRRQLAEHPQRLFLASRSPRELAVRVAAMDGVVAIDVQDDGLVVRTAHTSRWPEDLTRLGAEAGRLVDEVRTLDDSLEAVFGYLVS
jgi:ABC-2 type transport system ATP-binding protein